MKDLTKALDAFVKDRRGMGLIPATVLRVDRENFLYDCEDADGSPYFDVRMNATTGQTGVIAVPVVGSSVIITDLGNQDSDWVQIAAGTVSDIYLVASGQNAIHVHELKGIQLGDGQQAGSAVVGNQLNVTLTELLTTLQSLLTALNTFAVTNQAASAGVLAPLAPAYAALLTSVTTVTQQLAQLPAKLPNHLSNTVKLTK